MAYRGNDNVTRRQARFYILSITLSVLLSLVAIVSYFAGISDILSNFVSIIVSPFNYAGNAVAEKISSVTDYFGDIAALKEENILLKAQNDELLKKQQQSEAVREENEQLYAYLDLKREFTDLSLTNARVVSGGSGNVFSVFTIDKGTLHGIKKDMPVISHSGVVGIVAEEGLTSSRCISIINHKSTVGVYLLRSGTPGILEGDYALSLDGMCKIAGLAADTDAKVGDYVYTSGFGEIFPKDLCIGTVSEIVRDANTHTLTLHVTPMSSFESLDTVMVITDYERIYKSAEKGDENGEKQ